MKTQNTLILVSICLILASGCVVRSVAPWLSPDTKVATVSLAGTWQDGNGNTAFFTPGDGTNYNVLLVSHGKDQSRFTAALHRLDAHLFLVVAAVMPADLSALATLPGHLLFKVDLRNDSMKLYGINVADFEDQLKGESVQKLDGGSKATGYILTSPTPALAAFVKSRYNAADFFTAEPQFDFNRVNKTP